MYGCMHLSPRGELGLLRERGEESVEGSFQGFSENVFGSVEEAGEGGGIQRAEEKSDLDGRFDRCDPCRALRPPLPLPREGGTQARALIRILLLSSPFSLIGFFTAKVCSEGDQELEEEEI